MHWYLKQSLSIFYAKDLFFRLYLLELKAGQFKILGHLKSLQLRFVNSKLSGGIMWRYRECLWWRIANVGMSIYNVRRRRPISRRHWPSWSYMFLILIAFRILAPTYFKATPFLSIKYPFHHLLWQSVVSHSLLVTVPCELLSLYICHDSCPHDSCSRVFSSARDNHADLSASISVASSSSYFSL